ncbi:MAG: hypothetical protein CO106_00940 [Deltaproteobacteria bacterium CG_4_9_14_3_um_filter_44_9]|nr:MAG: hypothetical protein COS67_06860 [Deltaproteobacteria bacterium CG06_land_8_20_14_3_00_44_19]PIX22276.1 MAG: hypothetical protein COZ68_12625 [Deltaproteobacteria bacterium CG_4_8_14_3_um_filter_43_13]PIZ21011.1 MAG: hypothetical protein COY50_01630 [Deltaproteobacteria bacterium CG_4_10_14_0_8_um_filter_43_12]PJB45879.1 MAG: hypothetical protein CO106_00940 [Deltaproteobacteria bacterium CG_4_9_14_3_um_filter_44_9]HCX89727.1 hypothetical protein [Deltaproteobacteria bacterium]
MLLFGKKGAKAVMEKLNQVYRPFLADIYPGRKGNLYVTIQVIWFTVQCSRLFCLRRGHASHVFLKP